MKPIPTDQKLRGGYYTPEPIGEFLARWAIQSPGATVLEPSCGDGALLQAAASVLQQRGAHPTEVARQLHGVELEAGEAEKALARLHACHIATTADTIHVGDFFGYCLEHLHGKRTFDAIIGNPPFIRYQHFPEPHRAIAMQLMQQAGLQPNRLTNAWMPFVVACTLLLSEHGRLAMVIPAELLQVNYAAQLRCFLSEHYRRITLVTFKRLVFAGIQQEVVLLLGERSSGTHTGIHTVELEGIDDLAGYTPTTCAASDLKPMCHTTEKWIQYFLEKDDILLLRELRSHPQIQRAGEIIDVDVGIVTGLNEFFVLTEQQVREHSLGAYTRPIVGRSGHLQGVIFSEADWQVGAANHYPAYLLTLPQDEPFEQLPPAVQAYIRRGEERQFHTGYKCRIRTPWYRVPSVWTPDAFLLRQVHTYPKLILNSARATCTDTIHRVKFRHGTKGSIIAGAFLNSLTFAFAEVMGRSYGGGVLELEPREAEQLLLPPIDAAHGLDPEHIHQCIRRGESVRVLDETDRVLLVDGLGLSMSQARRLRTIWRTLCERRTSRR